MKKIIAFENDEYLAIVRLIMNMASTIEELPETDTKIALMSYRSKLLNAFDIAHSLPY